MEQLSTNQLKSLTHYLTTALGERVMKACEIDTSEVRMINNAKNLGLGFLRTGFDVFDAEFTWYDWPYRQFDPKLLTSLFEAWIYGNDEMRDVLDLGTPVFDVATGDDDTMTVTVDITLYSDRVIKEDNNGIIRRDGKRYSLHIPEIWVAEGMDLSVESHL
ncbi:TPA: phage tail protein [Salmonella enterica subsp. salamae serovar 28:r:e,n,z15]|nr:phage tail protein [Salmonella enterica subsp. salamae serovar 28:r:e,n,z15]